MERLKEKKYNDLYMDIAIRISHMSFAKRLKVGALCVKNGQIISMGWNGTPSGFDNNCEDEDKDGILTTKPEVVHAEQNLLMKLAKSTESAEGASMYITHSPCYDCSKAIIQSGIKKVYFKTPYRNENPINLLNQANVEVHQI